MNAGEIWWNQIGNSLRFAGRVLSQMRDHRSVILYLPEKLPFRSDFHAAVDAGKSGFCLGRSLRRVAWKPGMEPGEFVMEELCPRSVRAEYWPGQSVAEYLAEQEQLLLNDYYVWVTGIREKGELAAWAEFVAGYDRCCGGRPNRAVFLLEYTGPEQLRTGLDRLQYRVEEYDCRVFCLQLAAALENSGAMAYQAELALSLGGKDPELCARLMEQGQALLESPEETAAAVLPDRKKAWITSRVWRAGMLLIYPVLEEFRMDFISDHQHRLQERLPVYNCDGEAITDPRDLELGVLHYMANRYFRDLSREEMERLKLCHRVRNLLAHNKPLPYGDVLKLLPQEEY